MAKSKEQKIKEARANLVQFTFEDERHEYEIYVANDSEYPRSDRDWTSSTDGLPGWIIQVGDGGYSSTYFLVWSSYGNKDLEDAIEEVGGVLADAFPNLILQEGDEYTKELEAEAMEEAREELGEDADEEDIEERAYDIFSTDLTYTESGWIPSQDWNYWSNPPENIWLQGLYDCYDASDPDDLSENEQKWVERKLRG